MRVLMFGWEFPPHSSGGLGTACAGLTRGLCNLGADVTFVIPTSNKDISSSHVNLVIADRVFPKNLTISFVDSLLAAYMDVKAYQGAIDLKAMRRAKQGSGVYGADLFQEVYRYSEKAKLIALSDKFDVIHCHDWMTYPAGIKAKRLVNKPLVLHIHATEFDRTGDNPNQVIYNMEREGFMEADMILAVSNFTKERVIKHYGVDPCKVEVVHNAVEFNQDSCKHTAGGSNREKTVLFLGRITIQKGPEYFLYAAKKVLEHERKVNFVVAGSGDMEDFMKSKAAELGISGRVRFTGFLRGKMIDEAYRKADLYVMPSISEPFGITPLESMRNGTPVLISKQSGVSEVIDHCLKVDFWDIEQMANKIIAVLRYPELYSELKDKGSHEVLKFSWDEPASKCVSAYQRLI